MTVYPTPSAEQLASAQKLRTDAESRYAAREESFQRCDTDGFLSQWAHDLSGQRASAQATILEHGGVSEFVGLFRVATDERLPAKIINNQYGTAWMICDPTTGRATGEFYPTGARSRKQRKAGLEERMELATAEARIVGQGRGLSGSAWVQVVRTDGGWPGCPRKER